MNAKRIDHCPECGAVFLKPRSLLDHRRFFSVIAKAYLQWPEAHPFFPESTEHLRAWCLIEAGYVSEEITEYEGSTIVAQFPGLPREQAIQVFEMGIRFGVKSTNSDQSGFAFVKRRNGTITVIRPQSIAFDRLSQKEFGPLRNAVEEVIEIALGTTIDQLLKTHIA